MVVVDGPSRGVMEILAKGSLDTSDTCRVYCYFF